MSDHDGTERRHGDTAPGDDKPEAVSHAIASYAIGLALAVLLTVASFLIARLPIVWGPAVPAALAALAIAQMGIHLAFFLHVTTGPDNVNTVLALAFGVLVVFLLVAGSLWIMGHLDHNMMPMDRIIQMQR